MDFPHLYRRHRVIIQVRERLIGGIPKTEDIDTMVAWAKAQGLAEAARLETN